MRQEVGYVQVTFVDFFFFFATRQKTSKNSLQSIHFKIYFSYLNLLIKKNILVKIQDTV